MMDEQERLDRLERVLRHLGDDHFQVNVTGIPLEKPPFTDYSDTVHIDFSISRDGRKGYCPTEEGKYVLVLFDPPFDPGDIRISVQFIGKVSRMESAEKWLSKEYSATFVTPT